MRFPHRPAVLSCQIQFDLRWHQAATFGLIVSLLALNSTHAGADPNVDPHGDVCSSCAADGIGEAGSDSGADRVKSIADGNFQPIP